MQPLSQVYQHSSQVATIEHKQLFSGFDEITLLYRRFLQLIGLLPLDGREYNSPACRALLSIFVTLSIVNWTCFVSNLVSGGVPTIEAICETALTVGFNLRFYLMLWQRQDLRNLLDDCRSIWQDLCDDEESQRLVRQFESKVRILFKWLFGSYLSGILVYIFTAISLTVEAARKSNDSNYDKYLPFPWYGKGGENFWPGYKFNFVFEEITAVNGGIITTTIDSAVPLLIMLAAAYFRVLQHRLYRAYDKALMKDNETADQELVTCFRLHQRILNYCSRVDKITRSLFFVQLTTTAYNLSLVGIKLAGTDPNRYKYVSLGLLNLGQMFICQWAPDQLNDESLAVSTAAYNVSVPWMNRPIGKTLALMITRAQNPVRMTAAGVVYLSVENFGEVLKRAFSFFTVLRNFNV